MYIPRTTLYVIGLYILCTPVYVIGLQHWCFVDLRDDVDIDQLLEEEYALKLEEEELLAIGMSCGFIFIILRTYGHCYVIPAS